MSKRLFWGVLLLISLLSSFLPIACSVITGSDVATLGESGMHVGIGAFAPPYPYAIYVYIKPTSRAVAGVKYDVDLYEKGKLRGTKSITFTQPEINVQSEKMVAFPANVDEYNAYYGENIKGIFSIKVHEHPLPKITLIYPKGGEVLYVGDVVTIKWESTGLQEYSSIRISLYTDTEMNNHIILFSNELVYTGSRTWKVENAVTNNARIEIVEQSTGTSVLSNKFTILAKPDFSNTTSVSSNVVNFPDLNFQAVIRQTINKPTGDIYKSDLQELTYIHGGIRGQNISSLVGLEYCTNLTTLTLFGNNISDISPLASLTKLTSLDLTSSNISDISALASLINLTKIELGDNQISNVSSLASLTKLTYLNLASNKISDVSPLAAITNLTYLNLNVNQIKNITAFASLINITNLHLGWNQISDISPLVDNPGLSKDDDIDLQNNPLSADSINTYIPQLKSRGVKVYFSEAK